LAARTLKKFEDLSAKVREHGMNIEVHTGRALLIEKTAEQLSKERPRPRVYRCGAPAADRSRSVDCVDVTGIIGLPVSRDAGASTVRERAPG
jgi:hypothetical protein